MALPAKAKITALVCSGRSLPYDRKLHPPRKSGMYSLTATINPTRNPTIPHASVAIANIRTRLICFDFSISRFLEFFFKEHTDGWRFQIIILTFANSPEKCEQEDRRHGNTADHQEWQCAHGILLANMCAPPTLSPTTMSELTGIMIAVITGVSIPLSARESPSTLYITVKIRLNLMTNVMFFA